MAKFHVTVNVSKKFIKPEEVSLAAVKEAIKGKFEIQGNSWKVQCWHEEGEFTEWLDLDEDTLSEMDLEKIHKLRVVEESSDPPTIVERPVAEENNKAQETSPEDEPRPPARDQSTTCRGALPSRYILPVHQLSPYLRMKHTKKLPLEQGDVNQVLMIVYNHVTTTFEDSYYPTSEQYLNNASGILTTFPGLLNSALISEHEVLLQWKTRVQRKFQNSRKRLDCGVNVVAAKKRRKTEDSMPEKQASSLTYGIQNYKPQRCESEDDLSLQRHREWLAVEWRKKGNQDMEKVERLMRLTLSERRKQIVDDKKSVDVMVDLYPWLNGMDGSVKEFQRLGPLTDETDPTTAVIQGLASHQETLIQMIKNRKKMDDTVKELLKTEKKDELYTYARVCAVLLGTQQLLGEKTDSIFKKVQEEADVCIKYEGRHIHKAESFRIIMDGVQVAECADSSSALAVFIASLYVFNVAHPQSCSHSLQFFTLCLLGIKDETGHTKKTRSLFVKLGEKELLLKQKKT